MGCLHPKKEDVIDAVTIEHSVPPQRPLSAYEWKDRGNEEFKAKDYALAVKCYSRAIVRPT